MNEKILRVCPWGIDENDIGQKRVYVCKREREKERTRKENRDSLVSLRTVWNCELINARQIH